MNYSFCAKIAYIFTAFALLLGLTACSGKDGYYPGYWKNRTYISKWAGFKFELPENWTHESIEELKAGYEHSGAIIADSKNKKIDYSTAPTIYEFSCYSNEENVSNSVIFVNERLSARNINDTEDYVDFAKQRLESNGRFRYNYSELIKADLDGLDFYYFDAEIMEQEFTLAHRVYFTFKDDFAATVIIGSMNENPLQDIENISKYLSKIK